MSDPDATNAVDAPLKLAGPWLGPGDTIAGWTLGERIGEGGSSVVFSASRARDGFAQAAALKLMKTGAADPQFVQRFQRERRILQQLVHPHIVRLLDGGSTADGVPWYAMDHIDGRPLTDWATNRGRPEVLEALVAVCRAVGFAHTRLVVHCDLKPANVLVGEDGVPHVLDFGIAKLLDEHEHTGTARLLTPRWAAPEQLEGASVTTATDVFALGLLLWSMLTGTAPRDDTTGIALLSAIHEPIEPPSTFDPSCRGDLDAIVLRATAPEAADRYASADALADDLRRHLDGEAVKARDGVFWYRTSRWMRRNRAMVAGLAGVGVLLAGWAVTATVQSQRLTAERDNARGQAERAEATLDLLVGMLEAADPAQARGEELTVREVLETSGRELEVGTDDPALQGAVGFALGRVQLAVHATDEGVETLETAHGRLAEVHGPTHPTTLAAEMAATHGAHDLEPKDPGPPERAKRILSDLAAHGSTPERARAEILYAEMMGELGQLDATAEHAAIAREVYVALEDPRGAARALAILGFVDIRQDRGYDRLKRALAETEAALGTRIHPDYADILHELALGSTPEEAIRHAEESLDIRRKLVGETFGLATTLNNYGLALESVDPDRAVEMLEEAVRIATEIRGPDHSVTLKLRGNLGAVLVDTGRVQEGLRVLEALLAGETLESVMRAKVLRHMGRAYTREGDVVAARRAYERALVGLAEDADEAVRIRAALKEL